MPLTASIGLSRKVGQENYGSLGANCQLEAELDASLVNDAEAFHEHIRRLYALAHQAVNDELARQQSRRHREPEDAASGGNGSRGRSTPSEEPPASNKQIKFLLDLARQRHQMNLSQLRSFCAQTVGVDDIYDLTRRQASTVIDELGANGQPSKKRR